MDNFNTPWSQSSIDQALLVDKYGKLIANFRTSENFAGNIKFVVQCINLCIKARDVLQCLEAASNAGLQDELDDLRRELVSNIGEGKRDFSIL